MRALALVLAACAGAPHPPVSNRDPGRTVREAAEDLARRWSGDFPERAAPITLVIDCEDDEPDRVETVSFDQINNMIVLRSEVVSACVDNCCYVAADKLCFDAALQLASVVTPGLCRGD